jgi:hypothetical protein
VKARNCHGYIDEDEQGLTFVFTGKFGVEAGLKVHEAASRRLAGAEEDDGMAGSRFLHQSLCDRGPKVTKIPAKPSAGGP